MVQQYIYEGYRSFEDVIDGLRKGDSSPKWNSGQANVWQTDSLPVQRSNLLSESRTDSLENELLDSEVVPNAPPRFPRYASPLAREETFRSGWPMTVPVTTDALVRAGMFFDGEGDRTICFQCGGGLCSWEAGDDPLREHARWYPECSYVRLQLGQAEIENIQRQQRNVMTQLNNHSGAEETVDEAVLDEVIRSLVTDEDVLFYNQFGITRNSLKAALRQIVRETGSLPENLRTSKGLVEKTLSKLLSLSNSTSTSTSVRTESDVSIERPGNQTQEGGTTAISEQIGTTITAAATTTEMGTISGRINDITKTNGETAEAGTSSYNICVICMERERGLVFLPCGHLATCAVCGTALNACPICRKEVTHHVKAFLS